MNTLLFEVRHAGRRLSRSPGFFFVTVLMLSLGTGLILIGTSGQHLLSALLGVCTFFAVLRASIGLYSVMAYAVNQRVREIGVRRALGADNTRVMALLFRDNAMQLSVALLAGLVLAVGFAKLFASEFVGVSSFDPLTYLAVIVMLVLMIVLASFVPTRRALKIQPQEALRHE